jgi:hypothetical protein
MESLEPIDIKAHIELQVLAAQHRLIGIHASEAVVGARQVPKGWRLDPETQFWVPPNLMPGNQRRH